MTAARDRDDGQPASREALDRTLRLMRDHAGDSASDARLVDALLATTVVLVGDRANLATAEGQHALMTAMLLVARSGARTFVVAPNVRLSGVSAPFMGDRLVDAVLALGADLVPGVGCEEGVPGEAVDLAIVLGDTPWKGSARRVVRLVGDAWVGGMTSSGGGTRWEPVGSPFGALAAAGLAAGEAFKATMARLRSFARHAGAFDDLFAPTADATVALAPIGSRAPTGEFGDVDFISGGAITQAALYALARIPGASCTGRVIEPEASDVTNLNRYALLSRSRCGSPKVEQITALDLAGLSLTGVPTRYAEETLAAIAPLASTVLVGVDHIPTRWLVQRARPQWLGVGATSHYSAMASYHESGTACARCLHPYDEPDAGPIPTAAFVSFWAGLWLASLAARHADGERLSPEAQSVYMTPLRSESVGATWLAPVPPRPGCPVRCPL